MIAEDDLVETLKALAHPLRWKILASLAAAERNVGDIEQATRIGQPALSQQLGVLRKAGIVTTRKDAKLVFYSLDRSQLAQVTEALALLAPAAPTAVSSTPVPGERGGRVKATRNAVPGAANFARLS